MAKKKQKRTTKKKAFLSAFAQCGNISHACRLANCSRTLVYKWLNEEPEFKVQFDEADTQATENLEREAYRRACEGTLRPVYQGGRKVGTIREFSDTLLIFLLKGRKPNMYRDNVKTEHTGSIGVNVGGTVGVIQVVEDPSIYGTPHPVVAETDAAPDSGAGVASAV